MEGSKLQKKSGLLIFPPLIKSITHYDKTKRVRVHCFIFVGQYDSCFIYYTEQSMDAWKYEIISRVEQDISLVYEKKVESFLCQKGKARGKKAREKMRQFYFAVT